MNYYSFQIVMDEQTAFGHCLAKSPERAIAKIQEQMEEDDIEGKIEGLTEVCPADIRSLANAGLLGTLSFNEFAEVLAEGIIATNKAVDAVAARLVAKKAKLADQLPAMYDHLPDDECYSIPRGSVTSPAPSKNEVMDSVFSTLWS